MVLSLKFSVSVLKTTITLVSTNNLTFSIILELKCYRYHWLPISFALSPYIMMLNSVLFIFLAIALLSFSFLLCQSLTSEIHFISFWWLTGFSCLQSITQMDCIDISPYQSNSIDIRYYYWDIGLFMTWLSSNHSTARRLESQAPWYKIQGLGHCYLSLLYHISLSAVDYYDS